MPTSRWTNVINKDRGKVAENFETSSSLGSFPNMWIFPKVLLTRFFSNVPHFVIFVWLKLDKIVVVLSLKLVAFCTSGWRLQDFEDRLDCKFFRYSTRDREVWEIELLKFDLIIEPFVEISRKEETIIIAWLHQQSLTLLICLVQR